MHAQQEKRFPRSGQDLHDRLTPRGPAQLMGVLLVAGVLICGACSGSRSDAQGPPQFPPAAVKLAVARPADIEDASEYVATLKSLHSTAIQPQVDGQITHIYVKSGDHVKTGAPLMQIDGRRQQASVSSQEADRAAKEATVTFARSQRQRAVELFGAGAVSKQELEQAENALRTAEAELQSLQAQVQEGRVQLRYFSILAPTGGVVGDIPVRVGNQVTPETVLTRVEQNDTLEVYVSVPLERSGDLKVGLPIQILGDAAPDVETRVSFVSPHVDNDTQSVLVKGLVENPDGQLRSSQFVRARIVFKSTRGLLLPVVAVSRINGQFFAYVAEQKGKDLVARQRAVKLGSLVGDDYAVLSGIQPNERVVVSGVQKLADGAPIAPQT